MINLLPLRRLADQRTSDNQYISDEGGHSQGDTTSDAEDMLPHQLRTPFLPNEILDLIVHDYYHGDRRHLYTFSLVSKQFYEVANPLLWREPIVRSDPNVSQQRFLDCLIMSPSLGDHVRSLQFENTTCTDRQFSLLLPHVRRLETLLMENSFRDDTERRITNASLASLPRYCSQLTTLAINTIALSEPTVRALGQYAHHLRDLSMCLDGDGDGGAPWDHLFSALGACPLVSLAVYPRSAKFKVTLTETMAMDVVTHFPRLMYLKMTALRCSARLLSYACAWPHLKELRLGQYNVDPGVLIAFVQTHRLLEHLVLRDITLSDACLDTMAHCLPELHQVVLFKVDGISAQAVARFIRHAHRLERLLLMKCGDILRSDFFVGTHFNQYFKLCKNDLAMLRDADAQGAGHQIETLSTGML
ncbi:unnamed protein product [Absidia cylindrospora]